MIFFLNFIESFKVVLINIVAIVTLGLLKRNTFLRTGYDVIIFVYDVTNKT